ncbi:MAG: hypothetical protein LBV37_02735 [Mycoplasmataceae bacterium]|jgi:hypothetical protein|nr:hypothetical protein [Mycoplasmataceae bacterium]
MKLKSTIKQIKDLDMETEIVIKELRADHALLAEHEKRLKTLFKNDSQELINTKIHNIVIRDNLFNEIMMRIVPCFEVTFDGDEVKQTTENFKKQMPDRTPEVLDMIARRTIIKTLVFGELIKLWGITASDEEVRKSLEQYYQFSNESIRQYLDDKEKFEAIRSVLLEEKTANELIKRFKHRFDLKMPRQPSPDTNEKK